MEQEHAKYCGSLAKEAKECNCHLAYGFRTEQELEEAARFDIADGFRRWKRAHESQGTGSSAQHLPQPS